MLLSYPYYKKLANYYLTVAKYVVWTAIWQ